MSGVTDSRKSISEPRVAVTEHRRACGDEVLPNENVVRTLSAWGNANFICFPYFVCLSCADRNGRNHIAYKEPQPCLWCSRGVFTDSRIRKRTRTILCSKRCESRFYRWRKRSSRYWRCAVCSQFFTPKRADAKHCSPACKQKSYRRQHSEKARQYPLPDDDGLVMR
jgi:hypothetical protein